MADIFTPDQLEQLRSFYEAIGATTDRLNELNRGGKSPEQIAREQSEKDLQTRANKLKRAFEDLGQGIQSTYNAMTTVNGGQQKYSQGIAQTTQAMGALAMLMGGPLTKAIGLSIIAFGKLAEGVLKQNDAILEAYDDLGKFGGVIGTTTDGLLNFGRQAQYTSHNIRTFVKAATEAGQELVVFGGSVSKGMRKFADLTATTDETLASLRRLGIGQDEFLEMQKDYVGFQRRSGRELTKDTAKLREETLKYTGYLIDLSNITGTSLEQQKRAQQKMENDARYQLYIQKLEQKGDQESLKQADNLQKAYQYLASNLPDQASDIMAFIATQGTIANDRMSAVFQGSLGQLPQWTESLKKGIITGQDLAKMYEKSSRSLQTQLTDTFLISDDVNKAMGDFGITIDLLGRRQLLREQQDVKVAEKERKQQDNLQDRRMAMEIQRLETERQARAAQDEFNRLLGKVINPVLQGFGYLMEQLNKVSAKVLKFFNRLVEDEIETSVDAKKALEKKRTERVDIESQMSKVREERPRDFLLDERYISLMAKRNKVLQDEKDLVDQTNSLRQQEINNIKEVQKQEYEKAKADLDFRKMATLEFERLGKVPTKREMETRVSELAGMVKTSKEGAVNTDQLRGQQLPGMEAMKPKQEVYGAGPEKLTTAPKQRSLKEVDDLIREQNYREQQTRQLIANLEDDKKYIEEQLSKKSKELEQTKETLQKRSLQTQIDTLKKELKDTEGKLEGQQSQIAREAVQRRGMMQERSQAMRREGVTGGAKAAAPTDAKAPSGAMKVGDTDVTWAQKRHDPVTEAGGSTRSLGEKEKVDLKTVTSKSGATAKVNTQYADAFQQLVSALDNSGYVIKSMGGYNDRDVTGQPGVKSIHAYGGAIDINPKENPYGSTLKTDMPADVGKFAEMVGLGWGGNWTSVKDPMHFSAAVSEGGKLLQARDGGVFKGPETGYPVVLHDEEAVVPLKNRKIPVTVSLSDDGVLSKIFERSANQAMENIASQSKENPLLTNPSGILSDKLKAGFNIENGIQGKILEKAVDRAMMEIPGLKELKQVQNFARMMSDDNASTASKIFEVVKMLNPKIALLAKVVELVQNRDQYLDALGTGANALQGAGAKIGIELDTSKLQTIIETVKANQPNPAPITTAETMEKDSKSDAIVDLLSTKLDTLIEKMDENNNTQDKLLNYARS